MMNDIYSSRVQAPNIVVPGKDYYDSTPLKPLGGAVDDGSGPVAATQLNRTKPPKIKKTWKSTKTKKIRKQKTNQKKHTHMQKLHLHRYTKRTNY